MWTRDVLEEQAQDGAGSAGGNAEAAPAVAAAPTTAEGAPSLLSQVAASESSAAPVAGDAAPTIDPATGRPSNIPEKFWNAETKAVDSDKVLAAYVAAEKRIGSGDIRPKTPDEYKVDDVVKAAAEKQGAEIKLDPELSKAFAKEAHDAGLTQKQYEFVIGKYLDQMPALADAAWNNSVDLAKAELTKVWGDESAQKPHLASAYRAFMRFAPPELRNQDTMNRIGNNPLVLQVLASVGKELKEDRAASSDGAQIESVASLQKSEAYWNAKHPEHEATVRKVHDYFARGGRNPQRAA